MKVNLLLSIRTGGRCTVFALAFVFALTSTNIFGQDPSGWTGEALAAPAAKAPAVPEGEAALAAPVGSFSVSDGPWWNPGIPTQTCLESCANLFGGAADDYYCSTDGGSVNNLAWASSWGSGQHCKTTFSGPSGVPIAEDFKQGDSTNCGAPFCYISTYVSDWCSNDSVNFCFYAEDFSKEIVAGNDIDGQDGIDLAVEVGIQEPASYDFTINYNQSELPPVQIEDAVPAEWRVAGLVDDSLNCTYESANGKDNDKSATLLTCLPDTTEGSVTVEVDARCHGNNKNTKCKPTSCGALYLNNGAAAYELDPDTGEPVVDDEGNRLPPLLETNNLCLVAVSDLNGGGIDYTGNGDEDGDGIPDHEEACGIGTDPCLEDTDEDGVSDFDEVASGCMDPLNPDTDGDTINDGDELAAGTDPCDPDTDADGYDDNVDSCPLEGPADPALGEILGEDGCIRQSQCSDGLDNEPDGNTDYPDDLSCDDILDDSEDTIDPVSTCPLAPGNTINVCTMDGWSVRCQAWSGDTCTHMQQRVDSGTCNLYSDADTWHDITPFNNLNMRTTLNFCAMATGDATVVSEGSGGTATAPHSCGWAATTHPICESSRATYHAAGFGIDPNLGLMINDGYCANDMSLLTVECAGW